MEKSVIEDFLFDLPETGALFITETFFNFFAVKYEIADEKQTTFY